MNIVHGVGRQSIQPRNRGLRFSVSNSISNLNGGCVINFGAMNTRAQNTPSFSSHIGKVFRSRSKEHVVRITARPIVALVANAHSRGNVSVSQNVGSSMCSHGFLVETGVAVSSVAKARLPVPAFLFASGVNEAPELRGVIVFVGHKKSRPMVPACGRLFRRKSKFESRSSLVQTASKYSGILEEKSI